MITVLGIHIYDAPLSSAVSGVIKVCEDNNRRENNCISAADAHVLVNAQRYKEYASILKSYLWNLPDGMPCVWVGRLKGARAMERCYGPEFFKEVMLKTADKPIKHFLCGGMEGVAEELKEICRIKFKNENIVGVCTPPFKEMAEDEVKIMADDINDRHTDILWIGVSTPKQHMLAKRLSKYTEVHFIITIGAAFDFHTDRVRQAPKLLQSMGLEWLFRVCMEPGRLWKRYAKVVPLFVYYNLEEYVLNIIGRTNSK